MARYGITTDKAFGIPIPELRRIARTIGKNHNLAQELWKTGFHEARILAGMIGDPKLLSDAQMEEWTAGFNSWDLCDQCCNNLFAYSSLAHSKAVEWSNHPQEFVKRAGFVIMAVLAVHDKKSDDSLFISFLPLIENAAVDQRNFVKKAVNWALRQIGKRNPVLHRETVRISRKLLDSASPSARWIGRDALRELTSDKILTKLRVHYD